MVQVARFARFSLGHFPTALEPMDRLTAHLRERHTKVPRLWFKRDDCTGLATGGNKTRKLEFLVGEAIQQKADVLITQGATQSNHARQTAAAAARAGMECKLFLEKRQVRDEEYELSGNVLLDDLLGAEIVDRVPAGTNLQEAMELLAGDLREQGRKPYVIPGGGSNALGAVGYVVCAQELESAPIAVDWVVHGTGSTGTQAGLVAGLRAMNSPARVLGISVRQPQQVQIDAVFGLAERTAALIGAAGTVAREHVLVDDRWVGDGYGVPTDSMIEAVRLVASTEGILLDPVYSGKGFAGLLGNIADGTFAESDNVVFLHTGGSAGLFGYRSAFERR
ncbi:D-cysteine desulfhydrase [Amycolatopsis taiwanensis]|uniref:1-aminocyclopropane-1-carboxylate deaminase n=1 Tax=Amycolatopsis taiwanensis TaxID=342230 RepID=A0A9W6VKI1_9PSEU|nr:D-cysteine desulfhydrase [Amycolatopsis taiwanensis]GLY70477.1 1-aminocyclopropane-1-carboxylate deaminase [Amycolatopsis taiwanensis]